MNNNAPAINQAGQLLANGTFIVSRTELPNGWREIHRVGKLKIRGEREPRTINYNDYAKLITFYSAQERLIKDRKHVMVTLTDGLVVNTADITSLEQAEEEHFTEKIATVPDEIKALPTQEITIDLDGKIIAATAMNRITQEKAGDRFRIAKCHYRENQDGKREYLTDLAQIPDALEYRSIDEPGYAPALVQHFKYGIPQL